MSPVLSFGVREDPCGDCIELSGQWHCNMNCGPRLVDEAQAKKDAVRHALLTVRENIAQAKDLNRIRPDLVAYCDDALDQSWT